MYNPDIIQEALRKKASLDFFERGDFWKIYKIELDRELSELKDNADANTVAELKALKGYKRGLKFLLGFMEKLRLDGDRATEQQNKWIALQHKKTKEIDSREL